MDKLLEKNNLVKLLILLIIPVLIIAFFVSRSVFIPEEPAEKTEEEILEGPEEEPETLEPGGTVELRPNTEETNEDLLEFQKFLNDNFQFKAKSGTMALSVDDFLEKKQGGEQDFAFYASQILYEKGYIISFVFVYEYTDKDSQKKKRYLTVFNDAGTPRYFYFDNQGAHLVSDYGRNFLELCLHEQTRTGLKVNGYGTVIFGNLNLEPSGWEKFDY